MSNKNEVVPPLVLVQNFTGKYPGVWDRIDLLREKTLQGEIDARWDFDLCYCPISVAMGALSSFGPLQQISGPAGAVAACAAWRRMKMIKPVPEMSKSSNSITSSGFTVSLHFPVG